MYLSGNFNRQIRRTKIFETLICVLIPLSVIAEEDYPPCFPPESSWGNIQILESPVTDAEIPIIGRNRHTLGITYHKTDAAVPAFYGFTYLKRDTQKIPEITSPYSLEAYFRTVPLSPLHEELVTEERIDRLYGFTPELEGTWVIFLVAFLNEIPFLEQQGLRIYPAIERERGGTIFSGSSMNLTEVVDYKACVISSNQ